MSYNLKNKTVVMFAIAFAFSLAFADRVRAEDVVVAEVTQPTLVEVEQPAENVPATPSEDDPFGLDDPMADLSADISAEPAPVEDKAPRGRMPIESDARPNAAGNAPESKTSDSSSDSGMPEISIDPDAPKTPFEKYGNTILSRVDNELFNQMSEIEKQTTLLNLELKREEVKNRIDALKAQRERAKQEELDREALREKQARDDELQRQKALLQEQMRLKEKEMELEKIKQAKVLSEYMNEMLMTNQQWVEINGKLATKVRELQEERKNLIAEIETKLSDVNQRAVKVGQNAEETRVAYERKVSAFNKQIDSLKKIITEKETALQNATAVKDTENPFADNDEYIDENAVDMSKEYAIMDITGKGENIVAKIVSQDGTTFTVRKGSVLKGGEVVTNISDKFITFENHGAKSYLYTGGTVLQYEPTQTFNEATKTPNIAMGTTSNSQVIRNVRGAGTNVNSGSTLKDNVNAATQNGGAQSNPAPKPSASKGIASFSQGMMVE